MSYVGYNVLCESGIPTEFLIILGGRLEGSSSTQTSSLMSTSRFRKGNVYALKCSFLKQLLFQV
jgi:hypothetical protein